MKLSVIIPIYNEEVTCANLIEKVKSLPLSKQIIVVDDGSTDKSTEILKQIDGIELIQHQTNRGKGASVKSATPRIKGEYVILQDGDLEYDPGDYENLLQPLQTGLADVVFGSRWLGKKPTLNFHYLGNKIITAFANFLNGSKLTDLASCYKVMPSSLFRSLNIQSNGFGLEAEITTKIFNKKYKVIEKPINYTRRSIKEGKKLRLKDGLIAAWSCIYYRLFATENTFSHPPAGG